MNDQTEGLDTASKKFEEGLLAARDRVSELVQAGQLTPEAGRLLRDGVDLMLVHEGILPPDSDIDEERLFGESE